jgi:hypothetical protein
MGIPPRTLRRRLYALHLRYGNVLRAHNRPGTVVRKWWFNPVALKAGLERDPDDVEATLGEHRLQLEELQEKVNALKQAYNHLKRQMKTTRPVG